MILWLLFSYKKRTGRGYLEATATLGFIDAVLRNERNKIKILLRSMHIYVIIRPYNVRRITLEVL